MTVHTDSKTAKTLQQLLDSLSQQPGALLYRDDYLWRALAPGEPGQVLAVGDDLKPYWAWPADLE